MRRRLMALIAILALAALPALAELEVGAGLTPIFDDSEEGDSGDLWTNSFKTLHLGWRTLGIVYLSGDFMVVPPGTAQGMTSYWDEEQGTWVEGIYRPAVVSVYDAGIKVKIKSFSFFVQAGLNQFYLYKQDELENFQPPNIGVNFRAGAGLRLFKFLGFEASAISIQPSFEDAVSVVEGVFAEDELLRQDAVDKLLNQIVPTIQIVLYL